MGGDPEVVLLGGAPLSWSVVSAGRECFAPVICAPAFLPADAETFLSIAKGVPTLHACVRLILVSPGTLWPRCDGYLISEGEGERYRGVRADLAEGAWPDRAGVNGFFMAEAPRPGVVP